MEGESGTVVIRLRAAVLHCRSQGDGARAARIVCHAIWRMLVGSLVREAEAAPSCGALHPLRPLGGPRVARIVCRAIWRMLVWGFRTGSGSSALLRYPASASALGRASRCTNRLPCDMANARLGLSYGKRKQRPLAVPCIRFGPWAGLASCRPLRQKFLPVSAAGSGRNFSPSRRPVPRRGR